MKFVLIGPVYPYKGGIAHYTSLLCSALRKKHDVLMISYKMQYPKILYKKEQRSFDDFRFKVDDTKYWINTANPFNIRSVARKIRSFQPNAVIIQWWHPYFAPCYYILCKALKQIPVMFVCHNVFPHERFPMDKFLSKKVLKLGSGYIVQSHMDERDLLTIKSDAVYKVTPHPTYNAFRIQNMSKKTARDLLQIPKEMPVLLFFGFVRPYKGLKYLLDAMELIKIKMPEVQLWIVGDLGEDNQGYIEQARKLGNSVVVVEGYIADQEVEKYFMACDVVVLPYISATQSGIVQMAYGFEKPVIVTNVGGLPDVVEDGRTGYVVQSKNVKDIADAVFRFYGEDKDVNWEKNIQDSAGQFSWDVMVEQIEKILG